MTVRRWAFPILWAGAILTVTSIPNPAVPTGFERGDKIVHVLMYGPLGFLALRAGWEPRAPWRGVLVLLGVLLFAAVDEWHQSFIPGRAADAADWVADAIGAAVGSAIAAAGLLRREHHT